MLWNLTSLFLPPSVVVCRRREKRPKRSLSLVGRLLSVAPIVRHSSPRFYNLLLISIQKTPRYKPSSEPHELNMDYHINLPSKPPPIIDTGGVDPIPLLKLAEERLSGVAAPWSLEQIRNLTSEQLQLLGPWGHLYHNQAIEILYEIGLNGCSIFEDFSALNPVSGIYLLSMSHVRPDGRWMISSLWIRNACQWMLSFRQESLQTIIN
jgi:hypothetical protein